MRTFRYATYGMTVVVPFPCPGLPPAPPDAAADVVVEQGAVPRRLASALVSEEWWDAEPGRFLVRGGRLAGRFLVEPDRVMVERNPGGEDAALGRCFTHTVLAAVLRQRGLLVLHANAAVAPRGAVVIAGRSGAGKSTTLAALVARGCAMLADDITALRLDRDGHVEALPGVAQLHLTRAAAQGLGYEVSPELVQPWHRMKAAMPTDETMAAEPARLHAIYLLETHAGSGVRIDRLTGRRTFEALQRSIYGPLFVDEHPALFPLCAAVLGQVEIYRLARPQSGWSIEQVTDAVLARDEALR